MKVYPEATALFMKASIARTKPSQRVYRSTLSLLQARHPGLEVHQFTPQMLTEFCFAEIEGPPSVATIKARKTRVRGFFSWAKFQGLCPTDPSTDLKFTCRPRGGAVRTHTWLSEEELGQLVRSIDLSTLTGRRARVIVMLGALMGLRRAEIAGLRWDSFSEDLSRVTVMGKGQKLVELGVPRQVREVLGEFRAEADGPFLLPHVWTGKTDWSIGVTPDLVGVVVGEYGLAPHDLRRTYAGILEAKGMDVRKIQLLMRHDDVATTIRYLEKNPAKVAALADELEVEL